jgi:hypothetical protein
MSQTPLRSRLGCLERIVDGITLRKCDPSVKNISKLNPNCGYVTFLMWVSEQLNYCIQGIQQSVS